MNHGSMAMDMPTLTATGTAAAASATAAMDMGDMDHGGGMGGCKISVRQHRHGDEQARPESRFVRAHERTC